MPYLEHTKSLCSVDVTESETLQSGEVEEAVLGKVVALGHYAIYLDAEATVVTDRTWDGATIKIVRDWDETENVEFRVNAAELVALRKALDELEQVR